MHCASVRVVNRGQSSMLQAATKTITVVDTSTTRIVIATITATLD